MNKYNLVVKTTRKQIVMPQVHECLSTYLTEEKLKGRFDLEQFQKTGYSKTLITHEGYEIITEVSLGRA